MGKDIVNLVVVGGRCDQPSGKKKDTEGQGSGGENNSKKEEKKVSKKTVKRAERSGKEGERKEVAETTLTN